MSTISRVWAAAVTTATVTALPVLALAQGKDLLTGKPIPEGYNFQTPVTPIARQMEWLDDLLLVVVFIITAFVLGLLAVTLWKFHESKNKTPHHFTHNAKLEVAWTAIPVVILVIIAIPSLRLLFNELDLPKTDLTIKATGYQWYWGYDYPAQKVSLTSVILPKDQLAANGYTPDEYLLAADTKMVVPVDTNVKLIVTGGDVIHAFAMPSFGLKVDAIPGRLNEAWFRAEREGTFFGQCSQLCGMNHAYMPIVIKVVSKDDFQKWLTTQEKSAARTTGTETASAAVKVRSQAVVAKIEAETPDATAETKAEAAGAQPQQRAEAAPRLRLASAE